MSDCSGRNCTVQALRAVPVVVGSGIVGRRETAEARRVVTCGEVVVAGFGIAFFAGEFAGVVGGGLDYTLGAEGVVVGNIPAAVVAVNPADVAEGVEAVVVDPVVGLLASDQLPIEIEIAIEFVAVAIGLDDRAAACTVPIEFVGN